MQIVLGLGTNLGDKNLNLLNAIKLLTTKFGSPVEQSSLYSSEPYGDVIQDDFYNMVVVFSSSLHSPFDILSICQSIEDELGRVRAQVWGPRVIDIDILFIDNISLSMKNLIIPHPYINKRSFVLLPLQELDIYNELKQFYIFEDLTTTKSFKL